MNMLRGLLIVLVMAVTAPVANALHVDFTDRGVWADGTLSKMIAPDLTLTLSATGGAISFAQDFDGETCPARLACDRDGLGIGDDEITDHTKTGQAILLAFSAPVLVSTLEFLDLFREPDTPLEETEAAMVSFDGGPAFAVTASMPFADGGTGYRMSGFSPQRATEILLFADVGNDKQNEADFALAAIEVQPVPLPPSIAFGLAGVIALLWVGRRRAAA